MRIVRAKFIRKYLKFYKIVYNISDPYDILLDGNFIYTALKNKVDIRERLLKLLQIPKNIELYILLSAYKELESIGDKAISSIEFIKKFCIIIDDININGDTPSEKTINMLNNIRKEKINNISSIKNKKYMVATQDKDLRNMLGEIPGIPIIYLNKVTLVLEPPSKSSKEYNQATEITKSALNDEEQSLINNISSSNKKRKLSNDDNNNDNNNNQINNNENPIPIDNYILRKLKKAKAKGSNPLANLSSSKDSNTSKKRKLNQFRGH
jgi:U3 small nucleolar RNA-associated protein 23